MSRERDAQECLTEAIFERNNVEVGPGQFGTVKPEDLLYSRGEAWLVTLRIAAECLRRRKGHTVDEPTIGQATALLAKVLLSSQAYLVSLITA